MVDEAIVAAQQAKVAAVRDIVEYAAPNGIQTLTKVLEAIMSGASADDAQFLRKALSVHPSSNAT